MPEMILDGQIEEGPLAGIQANNLREWGRVTAGVKMDPSYKRLWVALLRSGLIKRYFRQLSSPSGTRMCCLGVAEEVVRPGTSHYHTVTTPQGTRKKIRVWDGVQVAGTSDLPYCQGYPSEETVTKLGLTYDIVSCLAGLNDDGGATYEQIAYLIERDL